MSHAESRAARRADFSARMFELARIPHLKSYHSFEDATRFQNRNPSFQNREPAE